MGEQLCQGKDVFERMNYLFQAGQLLSKNDHVAASLCGNMMVNCARKSVLRMEPNLKRSICKSCQSPLIPGETCRVRLISKPLKAIKWTCLLCKSIRTIPTKKGYKLWTDQPESIVKIFDYTPKSSQIMEKLKQCEENKLIIDLTETKDKNTDNSTNSNKSIQ